LNFTPTQCIEILERTPTVLTSMLQGLSEEWIFSKKEESSWTPYDIIGHLIHGERTDWVPRMELILSNYPDKTFEPFNMTAHEEASKGKSLRELLFQFQYLREINVDIVRAYNLSDEQLKLKGIHPEFGSVTLKELLATWAAHDLAHISQISTVLAHQYKTDVGPWKQYLGILNR